MQVIYHPDAEEEMLAAARYYESQAKNLGFKFLDDLDKTVEDIVNFPETWFVLEDDYRRHQFTHFPFAVSHCVI